MRVTYLLIALGVVSLGAPAVADRTQLLRVDLKTGRKSRIDPKRGSSADRQLDALLDSSTGKSFSTTELEKIERTVRRYLKALRPRAAPRLLLFVYPGRISRSKLKQLREVLIDIELIVDPCSRSVCRAAVGRNLDVLGRAMRKATIRGDRYVVRFKRVVIRTATRIGQGSHDIYTFSAKEVVRAGKKGSGRKLVSRVVKQRAGYDRAMAKKAARQIKLRRVSLAHTPRVTRSRHEATVEIAIRSDRVRLRRHVLGALRGAMKALSTSPLTPSRVALTVVASVRYRKTRKITFRCPGHAVKALLAGKTNSRALWSNYVTRERSGGTKLTFSEGGGSSSSVDEPDRTSEILAASFKRLAPCLQREAQRNRRFKGVTLKFAVSRSGRAVRVTTAERASARLKRCLAKALSRISFQRHSGAPRKVSYPMYIKR